MTRYTRSLPDVWTSPRPHSDASQRLHHYGPLEPMAYPTPYLDAKRGTIRLTALCIGTIGLAVLAMVAGGVL